MMSEPVPVTRRSFLQTAPAAGTLLVAEADTGVAAVGDRSVEKPLRVGAMNIGVYSHLAAHWGQLISGPMSYTGMQITHCWDIDPGRAAGFAKGHRCTAVKNFDDMLGKVDAVIDGGYYNHAWNHVLHAPYLEAGLPCLINRPFANSVGKAREMVTLARKHKAPILVPSALGHNDVLAQARRFVESSEVVGYHAAAGAEDYPTHGVHGLYFLSRAISDAGNPVQSVSYRARQWHAPPAVLTFEHQDSKGRPFFGTLHAGEFGIGVLHIHTRKEGHGRSFSLTLGTGAPYNQTEFWTPTLWAFQAMALSGQMPQSYDQILEKHTAFMAGWRSHLVEEGRPVRLADVPADWESPVALPNRPADTIHAEFKKKFG